VLNNGVEVFVTLTFSPYKLKEMEKTKTQDEVNTATKNSLKWR